jgi:hypothetical protein
VPLIASCLVLGVESIASQAAMTPSASRDMATATAGARYRAGWLTRLFLGGTYRDLWATPIQVSVVDLRRFAGGLTPTKVGGGNQTKSLRFEGGDGSEYVFRLVDKDKVTVPNGYEHSLLGVVARDQVSAHHPSGAVVADEILRAAGVLHATPFLAVLPDDSLLGEFRQEFAGRLGMLEPYPTAADDAPGFADAHEIIDSDELRIRLDRGPMFPIDTRAYLTARLTDMLLGDWDRHAGNWRWAALGPNAKDPWVPISRDRDKAFITYGGIVAAAGRFVPHLMTFRGRYPSIRGLTKNSLELDRRLLSDLEKTEWDSIAAALSAMITDEVIDAAVDRMPKEYQHTGPDLAAAMKERRDRIPEIATRFYAMLAAGPDIHATDAADQATVTRLPDGSVDVRLRSASDVPWFRRRFQPSETDEIRLYLHGGDDRAVVVGDAPTSLRVRIIGGNGANTLIDSSRVGGRRDQARFTDAGSVSKVRYGPDSAWGRRPWIESDQGLVPPGRDRGTAVGPVIGVSLPGDLGLLFRVGVRRSRYGFRVSPYAEREMLIAEYVTGERAWRLTGSADFRGQRTPFHLVGQARMSEFEVTRFHGLGNASLELTPNSSRVSQRQWSIHPAMAWSLGRRSELTFGPVLQFSTIDSLAGTFLSTSRPYGFGHFGQLGLRLGVSVDRRDLSQDPRKGILLELRAAWYPGAWDVKTAFGGLDAGARAYLTIPVPLRPILVLRSAARKRFGEFPFHESAFVGGSGSVRVFDRQRYAGDASVDGTVELQVPLGRVILLLPLNLGVYGFGDAGRVYLRGRSTGGWHTGTGIGISIGIPHPAPAFSVELGNGAGRSLFRLRSRVDF